MPKAWEDMSVDEKLEQLRQQHGKEIEDLRWQIGHLEQRVQKLEREQKQQRR